MSNSDEVNFSLKVVTNHEKNKVLFAEVDSDFADVLLSFLTLPLGTIVRLLDNHFPDQAPTIGSLNTLYQGLSNLETSRFCSNTGKQILLNARIPLAFLCKKLKLNLDDSDPTKYFTCGTAPSTSIVMNFDDRIDDDNLYLDTAITIESSKIQTAADKSGGVFAKETVTFLITDQLQIVPNSLGSCMQIFNDLGITEMDGLEERTFIARFKDIMDLLKGSLVSKNPLSDLIFNKRQMVPDATISELSRTEEIATSNKITVNALVRKSTNKVLLVEADEDFTNFLFSLLVIPLGKVIHLSGIDTSLGSVDNLYRSITNLDGGRHLKNEDLKGILLKPQLPPEYIFKNHVFSHITEDIIPVMPHPVSKVAFYDYDNKELGYVKGPETFMVTDDLVVTPFSALSTLNFLGNLKIPVSDVEELKYEIGFEEALNILKASLISTSALTNGLKPIAKKEVEQEK